jgi:hypothetical protein
MLANDLDLLTLRRTPPLWGKGFALGKVRLRPARATP